MSIKDRGFASISVARRREIARMGGKASYASGNSHLFTQEEAKAAGRKGGQATTRLKRLAKQADPDETPPAA